MVMKKLRLQPFQRVEVVSTRLQRNVNWFFISGMKKERYQIVINCLVHHMHMNIWEKAMIGSQRELRYRKTTLLIPATRMIPIGWKPNNMSMDYSGEILYDVCGYIFVFFAINFFQNSYSNTYVNDDCERWIVIDFNCCYL